MTMNGDSLTSGTFLEDHLENSISSSRSIGRVVSPGSAKRINSLTSKTYKLASTLFLTRRLQESLQTLEPLITQSQSTDVSQTEGEPAAPALISNASRSNRVKVWNLYLSLLNAIIELGPEEGKAEFGSKEWRDILAKARDGTIWEEVVNIGYGGHEGDVDADVVSGLVTLLLAHSHAQVTTQTRLETYLSSAQHPNLELSEHFQSSSQYSIDGAQQKAGANGTDTPRDLNSRIKILELYTLHVLPRNGEWQYAKDFIQMSEVLDEERREFFLQALQSLEEEKQAETDQGATARWQQEGELQREQTEAEKKQPEQAAIDMDRPKYDGGSQQHKRVDSEIDYGIDEPTPIRTAKQPAAQSNLKPPRQQQTNGKLSPQSRAPKKIDQVSTYKRGMALMGAMQRSILAMAQSLSRNPMILLRIVMFLIGLIAAFRRRDIRDRLGRFTANGWEKTKRTIGMGVKVSYL